MLVVDRSLIGVYRTFTPKVSFEFLIFLTIKACIYGGLGTSVYVPALIYLGNALSPVRGTNTFSIHAKIKFAESHLNFAPVHTENSEFARILLVHRAEFCKFFRSMGFQEEVVVEVVKMVSPYKGWLGGAVVVLSSLMNMQSAAASGHECIDSSVVLRHKYRNHQAGELNSLHSLLSDKSEGSRSISGVNDSKKRSAGARVLCAAPQQACAKLYRKARGENFSSYRRTKHYACSANYIVYADGKKSREKAKPVTNDKLIRKQQIALEQINAKSAWKMTQGHESVIVAVIDTGVDYTHEDLSQNVIANFGKSFSYRADIEAKMDPYGRDDNGHGTHVAGTIAAQSNNKIGVAGIASKTLILPLKFLASDGSGTIADAVRAIDYMVSLKLQGLNIRASNNSWGGGGFSAPLHAAIVGAANADILFIAAAGNEANNNDEYASYPAGYDVPNVLSVAALDTDDTLAYFSNYGRNNVDIAAPGVDVVSTYLNNQYAYLSGTSMASPHVAGGAALLAAYDSSLSAVAMRERLISTGKYNSEIRSDVNGGLVLNLSNMLRNKTSDAKARKAKK